MKKALLALFAIATVTAASAFAADKTDVPAPVIDNGVRPPMERDRGPCRRSRRSFRRTDRCCFQPR